MSDETCNGWKGNGTRASAYATWRIALEMFDGSNEPHEVYGEKPDVHELAGWARDLVYEYAESLCPRAGDTLYVAGWVDAFLDEVNWEEIAENMLSDWYD